jgi:hypothetical protein
MLSATASRPINRESTELTAGWYGISVNQMHRPDHGLDYFRDLTPVATAGYTIYIYYITPEQARHIRVKFGLDTIGSGKAGSTTVQQRGGAP